VWVLPKNRKLKYTNLHFCGKIKGKVDPAYALKVYREVET
jgi:hypothetical protein